jgi:hypothetical protein
MNGRSFSLQPFPYASPPPEGEITGGVARRGHKLTIRYALRGRLGGVAIPPPAQKPARKHGLWEETCFEFFLALKNSPRYWEFNLSPAGHWNVYRFSGYRQGMEEETAYTSLPFRVQTREDSLLLDLELEAAKIVPADRPLEVAVTAVIRLAGGEVSYWALTHHGSEADFHRRDSFIMAL